MTTTPATQVGKLRPLHYCECELRCNALAVATRDLCPHCDRHREREASASAGALREALEQALDRMQTTFNRLGDADSNEGAATSLYFGIEEAEKFLAAQPAAESAEPRWPDDEQAVEELSDALWHVIPTPIGKAHEHARAILARLRHP